MILRDLRQDNSTTTERAVTVGSFDGVHVGHQHLIRRTLARAEELGLRPLVVTFWPIPRIVLEEDTLALSLLEEKLELLGHWQIDVLVLRFDREFARMNAESFFDEVLVGQLNARLVAAGANFRFGYRSAGDVLMLTDLAQRLGAEALVVDRVKLEGEVVSSSRTREVVRHGQMEKAARLLGRPYSLTGQVIEELGRGKELGFPTANLTIDPDKLLPRHGVYAGWATVSGREPQPALCNIGTRPTVNQHNGIESAEVHLLDFEGDLYHQKLRFEFATFLRPELPFPSESALVEAVQHDCERARKALAELPYSED